MPKNSPLSSHCFSCWINRENYQDNKFSQPTLGNKFSAMSDAALLNHYLASDKKDRLAEEELVKRHLPLALKLSKPFGIGKDQFLKEDFDATAMKSLLKAIRRFSPGKNAKLSTFITKVVNNDLVSHSDSTISPLGGKGIGRDTRRVRKVEEQLRQEGKRIDNETVFERLQCEYPNDFSLGRVQRLRNNDVPFASLDQSINTGSADGNNADSSILSDTIFDKTVLNPMEEVEKQERIDLLSQSLKNLSAQEFSYLKSLIKFDMNYAQAAKSLNVTSSAFRTRIQHIFAQLRGIPMIQQLGSDILQP